MPQLDFFSYFSQYHYLLLTFFTLYLIISFFAIPSIHSVSFVRSKLSTATEGSHQEELSEQTKGFLFMPKLSGNEITALPINHEELLNMQKNKSKVN